MKSKILLSFVLMFAFLFSGCNTDEDMQAQYDLGYADGQEAGYAEGYDAGYAEAKAEFTVYPTGDYYVDTAEDPLTIREEAAQNAKKLGTVPRGEDVNVTKVSSHWGYVTFEGISGWINLDYCEKGKNPNPPVEYSTETVYVTDTGSKYHKSGCSYLKSKNEISLDEAERRGYEPCSRCY